MGNSLVYDSPYVPNRFTFHFTFHSIDQTFALNILVYNVYAVNDHDVII